MALLRTPRGSPPAQIATGTSWPASTWMCNKNPGRRHDLAVVRDQRLPTEARRPGRHADAFHGYLGGVNTFNAPGGTVLDPGTTYFVVQSYSGARAHLGLRPTASGSADDDSTGWSVAGARLTRNRPRRLARRSGEYTKFSVRGAAVPAQGVAEGATDRPANTSTVGVVEVDGSVTGNIASTSDRDPRSDDQIWTGSRSITGTANDDDLHGDRERHSLRSRGNGAIPTRFDLEGASEATGRGTGRVESGPRPPDPTWTGSVDLHTGRLPVRPGGSAHRARHPDGHVTIALGDSFDVSDDYISHDDDGGEGPNSRLTYTATATGTYYLEVRGLERPRHLHAVGA